MPNWKKVITSGSNAALNNVTASTLTINGSGSTLFDVVGSQGQLFSITDSLSGSLFAVSDISGLPILEVFSDDTVKIGSFNNEAIIVSGSNATITGSFTGSFTGDGSNLTNLPSSDPFPYTGSAIISGSLEVIGETSITGSTYIKGAIWAQGTNSIIYLGSQYSALQIKTGGIYLGGTANNGGNNGVSIGNNAGRFASGNNNALVGNQAGYRAAYSNGYVAIGKNSNSGDSAYNKDNSVGVGIGSNYNGSTNTVAIGGYSGNYSSNTPYTSSVFIGTSAGIKGGSNSVYVGHQSRGDGTGNTALGYQTGLYSSGSNNLFLGYQAGYNLTGSNQLIIANNSSSALVTGDFENNTFNISGSVSASTYYGDGSNLTGIETDPFPYTGSAIISGSLEVIGDITGSGKISLENTANNTIIGQGAGVNISTGTNFTIIGQSAGAGLTTTRDTVAIGRGAISNSNAERAVAVGYNAGTSAAERSVHVGHDAGKSNGGTFCVNIGSSAGSTNTTTNSTVSIGSSANFNKGGTISNAVAIGVNSTSRNNTVSIGNTSGNNTSTDSVFLGYNAGNQETNSNRLYIENSNSTTPLIYGEFDNDLVRINGKLFVSNSLDITGSVSASTYYGDGSNLTGIETDPFPYTGSAIISGSLTVTGSISSTDTVTAVTGSFSHLKGNSPITVQDPVTFQHAQGLDVLGNATIHSINEVELQTISKDFNYTSSLNITEITSSVNGMVIDYRLTNLNSGSRVGTFMYAHDGTELSYNDLTIPGGGIGGQPILSASLVNDLVKIDIENAAGFNFTGYAKKFNRLANAIPVADPNLPTPLLDTYSGAEAAFSLRKLSTSYTGNAIRIRENGSNTEIDIGFDVNNNLDTTALVAHCGSNNGFVVTWYDQSGNGNDATQTTMANQPKIYDSVTGVVMENGNPAVEFNGSSTVLSVTATSISSFPFTIVDVTSISGVRGAPVSLFTSNTQHFSHLFMSNEGNKNAITSRNTAFVRPGINNAPLNTQLLSYLDYTSQSTVTIYQNNGTSASGISQPIFTPAQILIGRNGYGTPADYLQGKLQEAIIYNSSQNRTGIESNINDYYDVYDTGLLADYPDAAAAYSVRLLHSVYTGPSLRVREDGTDTEANIGFDSNGDLDTTALLAHCGSNNGFVVTWYDQSGNGNDATQATAANQPKIVSSGVVELENGKPAVQFDGLTSTMLTGITPAIAYPSSEENTTIIVINPADNEGMIADNDPQQNYGISSGRYRLGGESPSVSIGISIGNQSLHFCYGNRSASEMQAFRNGTLQGSGTTLNAYSSSGETTYLGSFAGSRRFQEGKYQEVIIYPSDESTNRTGIESNINSYFNIYP